MTISPKYELGLIMQNFIKILREREENKAKNINYLSDSEILELMHYMDSKKQNTIEPINHLKNNYFEKNYNKYVPKNGEKREEYHLFPELSESYQDKNKPPFIDNLLTRYIYCTSRNWCIRLGQFLGLVDE